MQAKSIDRDTRAPDISVVMTCYNSAQFLAEAIESVLAQQTTRSWELLIGDDGSTDETLEIARRYATLHPQAICVLRHADGGNHGISASRNLALQRARGTLLAFLDSDDVWLPHHCETLAGLLEMHPQAAMVYGAAERWWDHAAAFNDAVARSGNGGSNYLPPLVPSGSRCGMLAREVLVDWFTADESLCPCICSVMVRTECARAVNGFCDEFRGLYDDQAFHAKVSLRYPVYVEDTCVARYRKHDRSCCAVAAADSARYDVERKRFLAFLQEERCPVEMIAV